MSTEADDIVKVVTHKTETLSAGSLQRFVLGHTLCPLMKSLKIVIQLLVAIWPLLFQESEARRRYAN
jgi:hypothetical protein